MRWKVGEFDFDDGNKQLRGADVDLILEPKAAALLTYFCKNPGRNIDRQELLDSVWYGQVVSDNSINRVIVLLRKALKDEDKVRKYIATVPKLGYNFIATVESQNISASSNTAVLAANTSSGFPKWIPALLIVFAVLGYWIFKPDKQTTIQQNPSVVPLSRLAVNQSNADLSSDGHTLLYTASTDGTSAVFMSSDTLSEPIQVSTPGGSSDLARWANRDEYVVYIFMHRDLCEFHKVEIIDNVPQPARTIYRCPAGGYTEISFSWDNSKIYFVERSEVFAPYAAYELDLDTQSKKRLSQPVTSGLGNHFVDVHPETGQLLLLSDQSPGKTSIYELDVISDSFNLLTKFDYSLSTAVWSHRDGAIVHPSMHPSYQLLETDLNTGDSQTIVSDSRRITSPRRINNKGNASPNYLFTSYLYNRDIKLSDGEDTDINSTVMDYLPSFSHDGTRMAFISKRSGYSKIWIKNFTDNSLSSIEPPDKGRLYFELVWSEDDQQILANTNTGIYIYSLENQSFLDPITLPLQAFAAAWHGKDTISYSHFEDQHWHAYRYNLNNRQTEILDEQWAFSLKNAHQQLLFDQQLRVYRDGEELTELSACSNPVWRYRLRIQLDEQQIYCFAAEGEQDLLLFDADMSMAFLPDVVSRFEYFSTYDDRIAKTIVDSAQSDIMRTQFSP